MLCLQIKCKYILLLDYYNSSIKRENNREIAIDKTICLHTLLASTIVGKRHILSSGRGGRILLFPPINFKFSRHGK